MSAVFLVFNSYCISGIFSYLCWTIYLLRSSVYSFSSTLSSLSLSSNSSSILSSFSFFSGLNYSSASSVRSPLNKLRFVLNLELSATFSLIAKEQGYLVFHHGSQGLPICLGSFINLPKAIFSLSVNWHSTSIPFSNRSSSCWALS